MNSLHRRHARAWVLPPHEPTLARGLPAILPFPFRYEVSAPESGRGIGARPLGCRGVGTGVAPTRACALEFRGFLQPKGRAPMPPATRSLNTYSPSGRGSAHAQAFGDSERELDSEAPPNVEI